MIKKSCDEDCHIGYYIILTQGIKKRLKSDIWGNEAIRSSYFKEQSKQMKCKVTVLLFFVIKIIAAVTLCFDSVFLFMLKPGSFEHWKWLDQRTKETTVREPKCHWH